MPASHLNAITDEMINAALEKLLTVRIDWIGAMPANEYEYESEARDLVTTVTASDVWKQLRRHEISLDSPEAEIRCAIGMACEPSDLPENACVVYVADDE